MYIVKVTSRNGSSEHAYGTEDEAQAVFDDLVESHGGSIEASGRTDMIRDAICADGAGLTLSEHVDARCGARRPGWETGPAIGRRRIPCIEPAGHSGDHRDGLGQTWESVAAYELQVIENDGELIRVPGDDLLYLAFLADALIGLHGDSSEVVRHSADGLVIRCADGTGVSLVGA